MMRGTRRTIVTAAASFAVVLGVGGVAAASGSHAAAPASVKNTTSSLSPVTNRGGQTPHGKAWGVRKQQEVTTTTVADDTTTTTAVDDTTSTTMADDTTTTVSDTTPTTVVGDDQGEHDGADNETDDANEDGHDGARTTRTDNSGPGSEHSGSHHGGSDDGGRG
jgi:hypothetical protein